MSVLELEKPQQEEQAPEELSVKDTVRSLLDRLPDDVTWDELVVRLNMRSMLEQDKSHVEYDRFVRDSINEGIKELEEGLGIPHAEVEKRMKKWLE